MKPIIALIAIALAFSNPVLAQTQTTTKKKKTVKTEVTQPVDNNPQAVVPAYVSSDILTKNPLLSVDAGIGSAGSRFHLGVGFHAEVPVNYEGNHFRFGGQTAFYIHPSSPSDWIIPLIATGTYDFRVAGTLKPYVGLGIGLSITHVSGFDAGFGVSAGSETNTDFVFLIRPGVNFGMDEKYYFEVPFGTMANNFTILPSIGVHF